MALLAFQALEQRGFLTADVSAGAVVDVNIEVVAGAARILANQTRRVSLVDRGLQMLALADELAAHIDVSGLRPHGEAGDQAALDQQMRVVAQDIAILAGARLGLVGINDQIVRAPVRLFGHERPLEPCREAGAAAAAQAGRLHFVDDAIAPLGENVFCAIPTAARAGAFEAPVMEAVEIGKDAILVCEHQALELSAAGGFGIGAS